MTDTNDSGRDARPAPDGGDQHYQPWLRNGSAGGTGGGGDAADGGVMRPQPLPTRGGAPTPGGDGPAAPLIRPGAALSAEELLARPILIVPPPPPGPTPGERIAAAAAAFAGWTMRLGDRADVPARVARLNLGARSRDALDGTARAVRAGAAGIAGTTRAGAAAAAPRLDAAGRAAREALARGASGARAGLGAGAARIGEATRSIADAAPRPGRPAPAPIESQLDRLLAEEPAAPTAATRTPADGLPLFGAPAAAAIPTPSDAAGAAPVEPATPAAGRPTPPPLAAMSGGGGAPARPWHRQTATLALAGAFLLAAGFAAGQYWTGPGVDRATTERVVHDYLLNNPEILPQAMQRLRDNQSAATIDRLRTRIEQPFSGAWAGAADGDVTLTVFTDYACTFCRASVPDIERLLREDPGLKVVFRELPILSADSEPAARLALAAARRGRYMPMHRALFAARQPDAAARREAAIALDVANDTPALTAAPISRELAGNLELARALGFDGTPSWVVGNRLLTGAVGYDQLREAVAAARAE